MHVVKGYSSGGCGVMKLSLHKEEDGWTKIEGRSLSGPERRQGRSLALAVSRLGLVVRRSAGISGRTQVRLPASAYLSLPKL